MPSEPLTPISTGGPAPRLMVIMFTDLVGSAALKEKIGHEQYRALKQQHDQFLGQAMAVAPSAVVIQDLGDGYFISFDSIAQAVCTALLFQWLMAKADWAHPFKSRVGLHLGEVEQGHSHVTGHADFISSAIDMASRTMSLAMGGQILMTRSVFDAARGVVRAHPSVGVDVEPPTLTWLQHGPYQFKGWEEPIEIFEVGVVGIAPLLPPADSDKARRIVVALPENAKANEGLLGRRRMMKTLLAAIPVAGALGVWSWLRRADPILELRRKRVEEQVASLQSEQPLFSNAAPIDAREVDRIDFSGNPGFEVLRDDRVLNMRSWKEVPPEKLGECVSPVLYTRQLQLRRKNEAARMYECQARTTGLDAILSCDEPYPSTYEIQRNETFVGQDRMKVRRLNIDVSSVPVGRRFDLNINDTYWNTMQIESEQWFGLIGYPDSFAASLLLIFPDKKPFQTVRFTVSKTEKGEPLNYDGPRIVLEGPKRDWVYWEIPQPQQDHVYKLHWSW